MQILGATDCEAKKIFGKHLIDNLCGNEILHAMKSLSKRQISKRNKAELSRSLTQLESKQKREVNSREHYRPHKICQLVEMVWYFR